MIDRGEVAWSVDGQREAALQGRVFLYQMAHAVFSGEPDAPLFEVLGSRECCETLREMSGEVEGLRALSEFCAGLNAEDAALIERSGSEYNRVVAGLGANRTSHPWESAYTNSKKLLFQVETLEVRNAYRAFGYLPEKYPKVADDHIALECAFMAALAQKTLDADASGDAAGFVRLVDGQIGFLQDHMLKWIGGYARDVHFDAPDGLYDVTASALAAYAASDAAFLEGVRSTRA